MPRLRGSLSTRRNRVGNKLLRRRGRWFRTIIAAGTIPVATLMTSSLLGSTTISEMTNPKVVRINYDFYVQLAVTTANAEAAGAYGFYKVDDTGVVITVLDPTLDPESKFLRWGPWSLRSVAVDSEGPGTFQRFRANGAFFTGSLGSNMSLRLGVVNAAASAKTINVRGDFRMYLVES